VVSNQIEYFALIVEELGSEGDLSDLLSNSARFNAIGETQKVIWITGLIKMLRYLHNDRKIVHRDIKTANLVVSKDEDGNLVLKFTDWDMATSDYIGSDTELQKKYGKPFLFLSLSLSFPFLFSPPPPRRYQSYPYPLPLSVRN